MTAPAAPSPLVEVRSLVKHYGDVRAVDGVSFAIPAGTCFGLLGPNGAGKTTTVEVIEGILDATSGEVLYQGRPIDKRFKHDSGIQFQSATLQDYLTVREVLQLFSSLYTRTLPIGELVQMCALDDFLDRDASKISGGQRQRLLLALALVNDPTVLFLDEPTTGLDPQARRNFWDLVRMVRERGKTVILTTHYMDEAFVLCDEIAIMDHGRIIAQGAPKALLQDQFKGAVIELPNEDFAPEADFPWKLYQQDGWLEIHSEDVDATVRYLLQRGAPLHNLKVKSKTLEDLFLELTGRDLRS